MAVRQTIGIKGARENNLQNVDVEIPRDKLVVVTGISGSGKSSLAFETVYAEGQRRFMESMSTYAKRFIDQMKKPDVDFVQGLSPVISIEQKTTFNNPRSTVGTMTDLYEYLRMLYSTIGLPHCPYCKQEIGFRTPYQMTEHLLSLPQGAEVEVRAPVFKIYGEDFGYLFDDIRTKGYRRVRIEGELRDLSEDIELDEELDYHIEAVIDTFVIRQGLDKQIQASLEHGLVVGESFLSFHLLNPETTSKKKVAAFYQGFGCPEHRLSMAELTQGYFTFNEPIGACVTCSGLGTYLQVHPDLLVPDRRRSIAGGAFVREAFKYDRNSWGGRIMYSLAKHYDFSLDTPFEELPQRIVDILLYGTHGERFAIAIPAGATEGKRHKGRKVSFEGVINQIDRRYRRYRKQGIAHSGMEDYLRKVMVEYGCPDCKGTRLKPTRLLVTIDDRTIHELGQMHLEELRDFLKAMPMPPNKKLAGKQIGRELITRLELLMGIGLDYLNLNRPSGTLSGGEAQRIRLSTQIGSGLMGMLYVLDEPSIGLHPKDNVKMIKTLRRLRDIGNTVIVVEHDEETIRAADHIIELGPGPGVHGGRITAEGTIAKILKNKTSLTGQFLSGRRRIDLPDQRRPLNGHNLHIRGARANNLDNIDVKLPLGAFICITGASGSGKSTLIHEILYKKLYALFHDSRVLSGEHDGLEGFEQLSDVVNIDQSPIGRSPRSNPATYIGFYDNIRKLFAATPGAKKRRYTVSRFSFNVKGGRCEECGGEGRVTTKLHLMADVEVQCPTCKGARYNQDTLEITYNGKSIAEVLAMTIEEGVDFFQDQRLIAHKLGVLNELGLGYLQIGHPAPLLSGGEAQRVKLADELGKMKRGKHNLYLLDEPTTGLHLADIQRLLDSLNRLVDAGHTVLVIEHQLDVIKTADYIIDLGPEGGHNGGQIMAQGTPEEVVEVTDSHTGQFLKEYLA
ncbi:MAG: excinuclease ABC subunit UvrA [Candidatus Latescibacteria bacterium]|nr:excinuclease ABC subunit UvrA [Candidatus Latescibacterota bacterium]